LSAELTILQIARAEEYRHRLFLMNLQMLASCDPYSDPPLRNRLHLHALQAEAICDFSSEHVR
jgi:hypothetical protein